MKKSNLFLIITLVVLIATGWCIQISSYLSMNKEFASHLNQAQQHYDAGLYQKALQQYDAALGIKENEKAREAWLSTYQKAYEEGFVNITSYIGALDKMCDIYPKSSEYREQLLQIYMERRDLDAAYDLYMECVDDDIKTDIIKEIGEDILYSFSISRKVYTDYVRCSTGYYMVSDGKGWGVIRSNGETLYDCKYEYISPYNDSYQALFVSSNGKRVYNSSIVLEATVDEDFVKTGAYVDGIIPLCDEQGAWRYYDCSKKLYISEKYNTASNFSNGLAAVCIGDSWNLIDKSLTVACQNNFTDIKIHSNGNYIYNGIMIAAVDGKYGIYDSKGNKVSTFSSKDADIYMGEAIAFQGDNGLWGYVDSKGNIVIEPQFDNAKSFSNGLGAVCKDNKWGFINTEGKLVIDLQFLDADYFTNGKICLVSSVHGQYYKITLKY